MYEDSVLKNSTPSVGFARSQVIGGMEIETVQPFRARNSILIEKIFIRKKKKKEMTDTAELVLYSPREVLNVVTEIYHCSKESSFWLLEHCKVEKIQLNQHTVIFPAPILS